METAINPQDLVIKSVPNHSIPISRVSNYTDKLELLSLV